MLVYSTTYLVTIAGPNVEPLDSAQAVLADAYDRDRWTVLVQVPPMAMSDIELAASNAALLTKIGTMLEADIWLDDRACVEALRELLYAEQVLGVCRGLDGRCHGTGHKQLRKNLCIACRTKLDTLIASYPPDPEA